MQQSKIIETAIPVVKHFEGFRDKAYQCSAGVWTLGYGTTTMPNGKSVAQGDTCDEAQAYVWLFNDLSWRLDKLSGILTQLNISLGVNQFAALLSFTYNLGFKCVEYPGATMRQALESKNVLEIAAAFLVYNKAKGQLIPGLVRRRAKERELFLTVDSLEQHL